MLNAPTDRLFKSKAIVAIAINIREPRTEAKTVVQIAANASKRCKLMELVRLVQRGVLSPKTVDHA